MAFFDLNWQNGLFKKRLSQMTLMSLQNQWECEKVRIMVIRNQPFEYIAGLIRPFLNYIGIEPVYSFSEYDDNIPDNELVYNEQDIIIIWIDFDRFNKLDSSIINFLESRLYILSTNSTSKILFINKLGIDKVTRNFNNFVRDRLASIPGINYCEINELYKVSSLKIYDDRLKDNFGIGLGNQSSMELARLFGTKWIPAVLNVSIRAIALDLDNTLYNGILGEDRVEELTFTPGHLRLQNTIIDMHKRGIMLSLISKNNKKDVEKLFFEKSDLKLKLDHFSSIHVGWDDKHNSLRKISKELNIGCDTILFIDDNIGEINSVKDEIPEINIILASNDGHTTNEYLNNYPGIWKWQNSTDSLRINDLNSRLKRIKISNKNNNPYSYLKDLKTQITFYINDSRHLKRISELSNKTNQFNTNFMRLSEQQVSDYIHNNNFAVITGSLKDNLSSSGIILICIIKSEPNSLYLSELCISCRVLGRRIEDYLIARCIELCISLSSQNKVIIPYKVKERNQPAINWISSFKRVMDLKNPEIIEYDRLKPHLGLEKYLIQKVYNSG
jgi:FkbH-like protein